MRTKNSILNIIGNLIFNFLDIILSFVIRTVFIKKLGSEYLGLNGLLTNIISVLSIAELGFGTAITFALYKPLAEKDDKKVSKLISFYKKIYSFIGLFIILIGSVLFFFLKFIIKDYQIFPHIKLIYFLYLLNASFWYFISYKELLINADQKNYKLYKFKFSFKILSSIVELLILIFSSNFILYLIAKILIEFIQRVLINGYITKTYKNIDFNSKEKLDKKEIKEIKSNVGALFFHKMGEYCINGTDNIILSSAISIKIVGLYSNYLLFINTLTLFVKTIFNNLVSSVGNLLSENQEKDKNFLVFKITNFLAYIFYGLCSLMLFFVLNDFITLWIGKEYLFSKKVLFIMCLNFYIVGMIVPVDTFKTAAGAYKIDKYTMIIQAIINLVVSIILVNYLDITGVLLGTLVSYLCVSFWIKPAIVFKHIIKKPIKEYTKNYLKQFITLSFTSILLHYLFILITTDSILLNLIIKAICVTIVYILMVILVYFRSDEFKYIKDNIQNISCKVFKKRRHHE